MANILYSNVLLQPPHDVSQLPPAQYDTRNITSTRFLEIGWTGSYDPATGVPLPPDQNQSSALKIRVPTANISTLFHHDAGATFRVITVGLESYYVQRTAEPTYRLPLAIRCEALQRNSGGRYMLLVPNDFAQPGSSSDTTTFSFVGALAPTLEFEIGVISPDVYDERVYPFNTPRKDASFSYPTQNIYSVVIRLFFKATFEPNYIPFVPQIRGFGAMGAASAEAAGALPGMGGAPSGLGSAGGGAASYAVVSRESDTAAAIISALGAEGAAPSAAMKPYPPTLAPASWFGGGTSIAHPPSEMPMVVTPEGEGGLMAMPPPPSNIPKVTWAQFAADLSPEQLAEVKEKALSGTVTVKALAQEMNVTEGTFRFAVKTWREEALETTSTQATVSRAVVPKLPSVPTAPPPLPFIPRPSPKVQTTPTPSGTGTPPPSYRPMTTAQEGASGAGSAGGATRVVARGIPYNEFVIRESSTSDSSAIGNVRSAVEAAVARHGKDVAAAHAEITEIARKYGISSLSLMQKATDWAAEM